MFDVEAEKVAVFAASREAAKRAEAEGLLPVTLSSEDIERVRQDPMSFHPPFLGTWKFTGYVKTRDFLIERTQLEPDPEEFTVSMREMAEALREGMAYSVLNRWRTSETVLEFQPPAK